MFLLAQFLLVNAHFTLNLLAALVCFAVAWLYYDSWKGRKDAREGTKAFGFFGLSISFVIHATIIEQALFANPRLGTEILTYLAFATRFAGYAILIIGQIIDPVQALPGYRSKDGKSTGFGKVAPAIMIGAIPLGQLLPFLFPLMALVGGFLYLRRATVGLEHHLKPISRSLFILSLYETLGLSVAFRGTDNIILSKLVAPFGWLWFIEHFLLIGSMLVLGQWIWGYLVKRLETQLMMIFTTTTLLIFLITTVFFTTNSINNLRDNTLDSLKINVSVLAYSINSKKAESLSDAQVIAQNPEIITATEARDKKALTRLTTNTLLAKKMTFLAVVSDTAEILIRADDPKKAGGSLSDDPLTKKALNNESQSSVVTKDGAMAPEVSVRAAVPIVSGEDVIGAVIVGTAIDNAFVDGLKDSTGLDASIYGDNVRSATTFIAPDGKSRWVGIKEETSSIKKKVLVDGDAYSGAVEILNVPYFSAYLPLKDVDNIPVGMLFVGTPQVSLLIAASRSIELTFFITATLLILSIFPAYFVSRYIIGQIR